MLPSHGFRAEGLFENRKQLKTIKGRKSKSITNIFPQGKKTTTLVFISVLNLTFCIKKITGTLISFVSCSQLCILFLCAKTGQQTAIPATQIAKTMTNNICTGPCLECHSGVDYLIQFNTTEQCYIYCESYGKSHSQCFCEQENFAAR